MKILTPEEMLKVRLNSRSLSYEQAKMQVQDSLSGKTVKDYSASNPPPWFEQGQWEREYSQVNS